MSHLKARVTKLSHQLTLKKGEEVFENSTVKMQNEELRRKLRDVTAERWEAENRLQTYVSDRGCSSKSVKVLRERNACLKLEVEKLTRKLKKIPEKPGFCATEPNAVGKNVTRIAI